MIIFFVQKHPGYILQFLSWPLNHSFGIRVRKTTKMSIYWNWYVGGQNECQKSFLKFTAWAILCSLKIFYSVGSMCNDNLFCSETPRLRFAICFMTARPLFWNICQETRHFMNFCLLKTHFFMQNETIFQKLRICKFSKFNAIYKKYMRLIKKRFVL